MPIIRRDRILRLVLLALNLALGLGRPSLALAEPPGCVDTPSSTPAQPQTINVNTANAAQLEQLPRIGPKKALAIIEVRTRLGGFKRPSQLLRVKGIGRATLRQLLPRIRLRDEPEADTASGQPGPSEGAAGADPVP